MDSAHVSLVSVNLGSAAFQHYRCDRPASLGINTANMAKIFKMMGKDDNLTLKAEDEADSMTILFEGSKQDTVADFGKYHRKICIRGVLKRKLTLFLLAFRHQIDGNR
jgi:proliferating cell nuclear antigen